MYIWILLATIMVAFSFYNLSPRSDKENVFSDIKAAAVVNRFRIEHLAAKRTIECELIRGTNKGNNPITIDENTNYGYTSFIDNLPIGYEIQENSETIHKVYCFKKNPINEPNAAKSNTCASQNKYLYSYVPIAERWLSKEEGTVSSGNGDYVITVPLPAFTNLMAKELASFQNTGWVWCAGGSCHLVGRTSAHLVYDKESQTAKPKEIKIPNALTDEIADACGGQPCLFAVDKLKNTDSNHHCKKLMNN